MRLRGWISTLLTVTVLCVWHHCWSNAKKDYSGRITDRNLNIFTSSPSDWPLSSRRLQLQVVCMQHRWIQPNGQSLRSAGGHWQVTHDNRKILLESISWNGSTRVIGQKILGTTHGYQCEKHNQLKKKLIIWLTYDIGRNIETGIKFYEDYCEQKRSLKSLWTMWEECSLKELLHLVKQVENRDILSIISFIPI